MAGVDDMTGVVLAGGMSRRFGVDKALIPWKGGRLVESVLEVVAGIFSTTLVLVKDPDAFRFLERPGVRVRRDLTIESHPLGGIYSGLRYARSGAIFVCACDMPHVRPEMIEALRGASEGYDVAVPVWKERPQPLCSVYSKGCLRPIESMIERGEYGIYKVYGEVRTRYLREDEIEKIDPRGLSFIDVDTPGDYRAAWRVRDPGRSAR